jgi:hypothetical protein
MTTQARRRWFGMITSITVAGSAAAQSRPSQLDQKSTDKSAASVTAASSAPVPAPSEAAVVDPVVEKILTRLEARDVKDLRANLTWETGDMANQDDVIKKKGEILYRQESPAAKFKVHLTQKIVGDRGPKIDEQHMFDGFVYTELNADNKSVVRRAVRSEKDKRNPYKVGEGAFPVPFGQKKADILHEFQVQRIPPAPKDPPKCDHLLLTPRDGTASAEQHKSVEFWINQEDAENPGLPIKVKTVQRGAAKNEESFVVVTFTDVKLNTGMGVAPFEITVPPGFEERFEPLIERDEK